MTTEAAPPAATSRRSLRKPATDERPGVLAQMLESSTMVAVMAVVLALALSGVLIAAADSATQDAAGYLFDRPSDFFSAAWHAVSSAYVALFQGALWDYHATGFSAMFKPFTVTLAQATPLIFAGLGLGLAFRAGMFNIGAQGQVIMGAVLGGWVGFTFHLPAGLHLVLAMIGAAVGGAIWAGIAGVLKARTGAHEVIVTIMLNNVAVYLIAYLLTTKAFQRPGSINPISPDIASTARYPKLLGSQYTLHAGFVVALLAAVGVWWLMNRSTIGFRFRAVGSNAAAARTAGISVNANYVWVMLVAGGLAGLGGSAQILGTETSLSAGIAASVGFDAITVALLGRSKPLGTVLAGILFGALRAGGYAMQARTGTPIDIVLVAQSLVVLFIAAPPLVRSVFRLPAPGRSLARRRASEVAA